MQNSGSGLGNLVHSLFLISGHSICIEMRPIIEEYAGTEQQHTSAVIDVDPSSGLPGRSLAPWAEALPVPLSPHSSLW